MIELIAAIILVISLGGALFILVRKVPVLATLSQNGSTGIKDHRIVLSIGNKVKEVFLAFEKQIFLHKFLSWVKVMTLRIETRIDVLLHKIRKKAQEVDKNLKKKSN